MPLMLAAILCASFGDRDRESFYGTPRVPYACFETFGEERFVIRLTHMEDYFVVADAEKVVYDRATRVMGRKSLVHPDPCALEITPYVAPEKRE